MNAESPRAALLDTSVVLDLGALDPGQLPLNISISTITIAELAAGPAATGNPDERARRQRHLQVTESMFDPLPFELRAARAYGEICSRIIAVGRQPRRRMTDLMIAAIALAESLPLLTRNPRDFAGLDGLVDVLSI